MKRSNRILLGVSIALITAASLHFTVGERFHKRGYGHYGHDLCGQHGKWHGEIEKMQTPEPMEQD